MDQDLALARAAISACADPAIEAAEAVEADRREEAQAQAQAAAALISVIALEETGLGAAKRPLVSIDDLGEFMCYVWGRVVRFGHDTSQRTDAEQSTMYLFNGATYEAIVDRDKRAALESRMKAHVIACLERLCESPSVRERAVAALTLCRKPRRMASALKVAFDNMQGQGLLVRELIVCPHELAHTLDTGDFIGCTNGVFDAENNVFFPIGSVPHGVRVSMCTNYAYVGPNDPLYPQMHADISEFLRTVHADDYNDPNDARLTAMRLFSGLLLPRKNECKKAFVFLGSDDSGKADFTRLIELTLGDYAVAGNRISLTRPLTGIERDLAANHKSLVCVYPEVRKADGSLVVKLDGGRMYSIAGNRRHSVRAPYRHPRSPGITFDFKPIVLSTLMPVVHPPNNDRLWIARFGSTFVAAGAEVHTNRRIFPRIENIEQRMRQWAPYFLLMMGEALRDFRSGVSGGALPLGQ